MREVQDTYRDRRQKEIAHIRKQNTRIQGLATTLGTNLTSLLEKLLHAKTSFDYSVILIDQAVDTVRNILRVVDVMQRGCHRRSSSRERSKWERVGSNRTNKRHESSFISSPALDVLRASVSQGVATWPVGGDSIVQDAEDVSRFPGPSTQKTPMVGNYGNNNDHQVGRGNGLAFYGWFSARSLVLDPAFNLYSTPQQLISSIRLQKELLQDPTTMDLVYKIFPFDRNPAPPHL